MVWRHRLSDALAEVFGGRREMASSVPKMLRALIIGPPGCGKGTISERIVKDFAMTHIASGDILRNHILKGTGDQKKLVC